MGDPFGHGSPARVTQVVDIAVATFDVAAAFDFDEDSIDRDHFSETRNSIDNLAIVPMVGPVISARCFWLIVPDFLDEPS